MNSISTTNRLLLIIVVPLIFYLLKVLSFIFIPLFFSMFIALLFLPLMRWLNKKKLPKIVSLISVISIIIGVFYLGARLVKISSQEIFSANSSFYSLARIKVKGLIESVENFLGIERQASERVFNYYLKEFNVFDNLGPTLDTLSGTLSMSLMTAFFVVLLLAGSINLQNIMQTIIFRDKFTSVKTFRRIEKDIIKFIWVKFL